MKNYKENLLVSKFRKFKRFSAILISLFFISLIPNKQVKAYREHGPIVKKGIFGSIIQDHGYLKPTLPASNGYYLFADNQTGSKAIALIGKIPELIDFLFNSETSKPKVLGVENRISDLAGDIYVGIFPYKPGERFTGLFPLNDFVYQLAKSMVDVGMGFVPINLFAQGAVNGATNALDAFLKLGEFFEKYIKGESNKKKKKALEEVYNKFNSDYYIRIHYLSGKGMKKIEGVKKLKGEQGNIIGRVSFRDIGKGMQSSWEKLFKEQQIKDSKKSKK